MKAVMLIFFIGSYTEYPIPDFGGIGHGIYTVQLNTETGELTILHTEMARNPSYLVLSDDNRFLYCVAELDQSENPKVKAFKINADFSLTFLNEQPISGGYPCHIATYKNNVLVACYATGNVLQFPIDVSGKLMKVKIEYGHRGSSVNKGRQEGPHAHQVSIHPNEKDIYVCDLGIDTVKAYSFEDGKLNPNEAKDCHISKGGGPRHLAFNGNGSLAYVINELTGNISVLQNNEGVLQEIDSYPSLPKDFNGVPSASAIRVHSNQKFLYAADRGFEAIAIFKISGNKLELIGHQRTQGEEVREFNITPDGKGLLACHQNSHDIVVYKIQEDGTLMEAHRTKEILSPVCIAFQNETDE